MGQTVESPKARTLSIVAPVWLHQPLGVFLQAASGITLLDSVTNLDSLLSIEVHDAPDVLLLYTSGEDAAVQFTQIKAAWPGTLCIAVVEHPRQREAVGEAGADVVLLQGVSPRQLLQALEELNSTGTGSACRDGE